MLDAPPLQALKIAIIELFLWQSYSLDVGRHKLMNINPKNLHEFHEFGKVKTAFAALIFRDVALGLLESLRDLYLR